MRSMHLVYPAEQQRRTLQESDNGRTAACHSQLRVRAAIVLFLLELKLIPSGLPAASLRLSFTIVAKHQRTSVVIASPSRSYAWPGS